MIRLENDVERKKTVYFSLWEDVGILQGEVKIEQRGDTEKSVVTLEWLIQDECILCDYSG